MQTKLIRKLECRIEYISHGIEEPKLMVSFYDENGKYLGDLKSIEDILNTKGVIKL